MEASPVLDAYQARMDSTHMSSLIPYYTRSFTTHLLPFPSFPYLDAGVGGSRHFCQGGGDLVRLIHLNRKGERKKEWGVRGQKEVS